ncbi:MAG: hypothetical protein A2284_10560 [Deltaproteobacteria bacterium RIFOXYA12_FULL_61_11]|nr:MAG: hypothetical protein A2284_10560 [Deltaproteobacteria bacterium RIFOXYA12_FULL_61_11]
MNNQVFDSNLLAHPEGAQGTIFCFFKALYRVRASCELHLRCATGATACCYFVEGLPVHLDLEPREDFTVFLLDRQLATPEEAGRWAALAREGEVSDPVLGFFYGLFLREGLEKLVGLVPSELILLPSHQYLERVPLTRPEYLAWSVLQPGIGTEKATVLENFFQQVKYRRILPREALYSVALSEMFWSGDTREALLAGTLQEVREPSRSLAQLLLLELLGGIAFEGRTSPVDRLTPLLGEPVDEGKTLDKHGYQERMAEFQTLQRLFEGKRWDLLVRRCEERDFLPPVNVVRFYLAWARLNLDFAREDQLPVLGACLWEAPRDPHIAYALGTYFASRMQPGPARFCLDLALRQDPTNAEANDALSSLQVGVLERSGTHPRRWFRRLLLLATLCSMGIAVYVHLGTRVTKWMAAETPEELPRFLEAVVPLEEVTLVYLNAEYNDDLRSQLVEVLLGDPFRRRYYLLFGPHLDIEGRFLLEELQQESTTLRGSRPSTP